MLTSFYPFKIICLIVMVLKALKHQPKKASTQRYNGGHLSPLFGFSSDEHTKIKMVAHLALADFKEGRPSVKAFGDILARVTLGREFGFEFFKPDVAELMHNALSKWILMYERFDQNGRKWDPTEEELAAVGEAINMVDDMHEHLTRKEYFRVQDAMLSNMNIENNIGNLMTWEEYQVFREEQFKNKKVKRSAYA